MDGLSESAADFRYPGDLIEPEIQQELHEALSGKTVLPDKFSTLAGEIFSLPTTLFTMGREKS